MDVPTCLPPAACLCLLSNQKGCAITRFTYRLPDHPLCRHCKRASFFYRFLRFFSRSLQHSPGDIEHIANKIRTTVTLPPGATQNRPTSVQQRPIGSAVVGSHARAIPALTNSNTRTHFHRNTVLTRLQYNALGRCQKTHIIL